MKRLVPLLALALAVVLPPGAAARTEHAAAGTATTPSSVSCATGDPVVWVNTETKVYHLPGSSFYGKTKHGKYACQSDATKLGAHAAKREGGTMGNGSTDAGAAAGTASGKHHRHRKSSPGPMSPQTSPTP